MSLEKNYDLKVVTDNKLPQYGSEYAAGLDLYCSNDQDIEIRPKETKKIPTGLKIEIPEGHFAAIYPRSSTGTKRKLMLANTVGIIDSDYRGEIMLFFYNYGEESQIIKKNERLAQLIIQKYEKVNVIKVDSLSETYRGEGGFGSTGK